MADQTNPPTTNAPPQTPITDLPPGGGIVAAGGSAIPAAASTGTIAPLPSGGITLGVDTDVEKALEKAKPAFGNTLAAFGGAIITSQKALDKSVIEAINKLNDTKIEVLSQVEIEIGDDGQPTGNTNLVKNSVSVLQYYMPVCHAWKRVDISMDVTVGSFHAEQGVSFSAKQSNTSIGGGVSWSKGFGGWFSASHSQSKQQVEVKTQNDAEWVSGQLLFDAELGVRKVEQFPPAAEISIGPQILITQNDIEEEKSGGVVTARKVKLDVQVRKASGAVNPNVAISLDAPPTLAGGGQKTTDGTTGKAQFEIKRQVSGASPYRQFALVLKLGDLKKSYALTL